MTIRVVAISDTHCMHDRIALPHGDILVHTGDFCSSGKPKQARRFARWLGAQPHPHKVVIAGNHDRCLEENSALGPQLFAEQGCHYLMDSAVTLAGLNFYGAPWQPWFLNWAFNLPRGEPLREKWRLIPTNTDVLLTHGPPYGILDTLFSGVPAGCEELLGAVARIRPSVHIFGHIHEGYGAQRHDETLFVNASNCTLDYQPVNAPWVIDVTPGGAAALGDAGRRGSAG